jgi:hypothetical protein
MIKHVDDRGPKRERGERQEITPGVQVASTGWAPSPALNVNPTLQNPDRSDSPPAIEWLTISL